MVGMEVEGGDYHRRFHSIQFLYTVVDERRTNVRWRKRNSRQRRAEMNTAVQASNCLSALLSALLLCKVTIVEDRADE